MGLLGGRILQHGGWRSVACIAALGLGLLAPIAAGAQESVKVAALIGMRGSIDVPVIPQKGLFGTVPVAVRAVVTSGRWKEILAEDPARLFAETCPGSAKPCDTPLARAFRRVADENAERPLARLALMRRVNTAVNHAVRYQDDIVTYGVADHWAMPAETALKGAGDCEDYAITKMGMLAALGVAMDSMSLAIVKDLRRGIGHALLAVDVGETTYVLDNQTDEVREDYAVTAYQALYSLSTHGTWLHGVRRLATVVTASLGDGLRAEPAAQLRGTFAGGGPAAGMKAPAPVKASGGKRPRSGG